MRHSHALALALLLPGLSRGAEDVPERLLPASTQIYLRWDGIDAHQQAYGQTSVGHLMKGDTGAFITGLFDKLQTGGAALLTIETLRRGLDPKTLKKMQADAKAAATLFARLGKHGFILAGQLRNSNRPREIFSSFCPAWAKIPIRSSAHCVWPSVWARATSKSGRSPDAPSPVWR